MIRIGERVRLPDRCDVLQEGGGGGNRGNGIYSPFVAPQMSYSMRCRERYRVMHATRVGNSNADISSSRPCFDKLTLCPSLISAGQRFTPRFVGNLILNEIEEWKSTFNARLMEKENYHPRSWGGFLDRP